MSFTRRLALAALASAPLVAVASRAALAQTETASSMGRTNYVGPVLAMGRASMMSAELALQRSENENLRQFAALEVAEQQTIAAILAAVPTVEGEEAELPEAALVRLTNADAGRFDLVFVETQIGLHNDMLALHRTLAGSVEPTVEAVTARMAEQGVLSHIAMLNLLQQLLGAQRIQTLQQGDEPAPAPAVPAAPVAP